MEDLGFDKIEADTYREPEDSRALPPPSIFDTFHPGRDPVRERDRFEEEFVFKQAIERRIKPPVPKRLTLKKRPAPEFPRPKYVVPWPKRMLAERGRREARLVRDRNFCDWERLASKLPRRAREAGIDLDEMDFPSPDVSRMKVMPQKPSITPSEAQELPYPYRPDTLDLLDREPRSGIFVNETLLRETNMEDLDSFNMLYAKTGRAQKLEPADEGVAAPTEKKKRRRKKAGKTGVPAESGSATGDGHLDTIEEVTDEFDNLGEEAGDEGQLTRMFRRKVSQASKATSLNSKELVGFPGHEEYELSQTPYIDRIVQKFRRDSEMERYRPPARKIKRGTLESHSFTDVRKAANKHFYYGLIAGTIHQGDDNFAESSRDLQGICMPIAAYCVSIIRHPNKWTEFLVDEILEIGDRLYQDSIGLLHIHDQNKELRPRDLYKYCYADSKKLHFQVYEPELAGLLRSSDKKIYDLQKALRIYFKRHRACILQTFGVDVAIWKDKHFYFFDAKPRAKDLWPDSGGTAVLANFYQVDDVASVLLDRGELGNWPFIISKLSVMKVSDKGELEEQEGVYNERSDYNILSDKKAVTLGSFDIADLCFEFTRNKQAIAMAAVSLVYSRITPSSAWHRRTVDKIMVIGNQLYAECAQEEDGNEMKVENLPAVFTIGPYVVNILLYTQAYADSMFKKGQCMLEKCLTRFFGRSTMAIVEIGRFAIAVWFQRNLYFCFDPYSRNNEGLACRNGSASVSMHTTLPSLVETITANFDDKEALFYIHPLKVLKIHRDPTQGHVFPKTITMDDVPCETFKSYRMRKSARKAVEKPVTVDYSQCAIMKLLAGEEPDASIVEVGSNVDSLTSGQLPPMMHRSKPKTASKPGELERVVDLDSPSLSDTQIEPERPPFEREELEEDLGAFDLTQEELEMQEGGEGEGKKGKGEGEEGGKGEGEGGADESFLASTQYAQVRESSLEARRKSAEVNTNITTALLPLPREILRPTDLKGRLGIKRMIETARRRQDFSRSPADLADPEVTQSEELAKDTNFKNLPDDSQIVRGRYNISNYGLDLEYMAPFVCMMAGAVAKKYSIATWSPDVVEYVLKSGKKVYEASKVRYDQVPRLTVPKVTLGKDDYCVEVDYLLDLEMRHRVVELALERLLFPNFRCGIFVTPSYACAVFHKNCLFYMFDPFGCNEVGLGEGPTNEGAACLMRFKTVHDMVRRMAHNKAKRDEGGPYKFARFVLSSCVTTNAPTVPYPKKRKGRRAPPKYYGREGEDGGVTTDDEEQKVVVPDKENLVGYQYNKSGTYTIHGTVALKGRNYIDHYELKEGHFVCLCACLNLVDYPVTKWDTRRVNYVIEQGKHVFGHARNLSMSTKRTIKNILIHKHFFDVIVKRISLPDWKRNKNLDSGIDAAMYKRKYVMIDFPNSTYVLHNYRGLYHIFDPYACLSSGKPDKDESGYACWTKFATLDEAKGRLKSNITPGGESYTFYTFEITSVRKAPKKLVIAQRINEFEKWKSKRDEELGRPFHEKESWLKQDPIMWSRMRSRNTKGKERTSSCDKRWNNWDIEIPRDLYSITGTLHQNSARFPAKTRGKQTLCNMVVAMAHLNIYPLCEWSAPILDSILTTGDDYFEQCIEGIAAEDYELGIRELKSDFQVFPYKFQPSIQPVVDGTIFTMRAQQFNLYKALRYFFESHDCRLGICCAVKLECKRYVAFGKTKEREYLMYDCQAHGPPMFPIGTGASYILRCSSLKRLVHIMVVTLRGGDFFLYDVDVGDMKTVDEQDKK